MFHRRNVCWLYLQQRSEGHGDEACGAECADCGCGTVEVGWEGWSASSRWREAAGTGRDWSRCRVRDLGDWSDSGGRDGGAVQRSGGHHWDDRAGDDEGGDGADLRHLDGARLGLGRVKGGGVGASLLREGEEWEEEGQEEVQELHIRVCDGMLERIISLCSSSENRLVLDCVCAFRRRFKTGRNLGLCRVVRLRLAALRK